MIYADKSKSLKSGHLALAKFGNPDLWERYLTSEDTTEVENELLMFGKSFLLPSGNPDIKMLDSLSPEALKMVKG